VTEHVGSAVVRANLEESCIRTVPLVQHFFDDVALSAELKAYGPFVSLKARVALHLDDQYERPLRLKSRCSRFPRDVRAGDSSLSKRRALYRSTRQARNTFGFCRNSMCASSDRYTGTVTGSSTGRIEKRLSSDFIFSTIPVYSSSDIGSIAAPKKPWRRISIAFKAACSRTLCQNG